MNAVSSNRFVRSLTFLFLACLVLAGGSAARAAAASSDYAVVVTAATRALPKWAEVVSLLEQKHHAAVIVSTNGLAGAEAALRKAQPRYVCFVARPEEVSVEVVRELHLGSRRMDADPYADFIWGIVTGRTAEDAKRVAATAKPLVIKTALTTTGVDFGLVDTALTISDGQRGKWSRKDGAQVTSGVVTNGSTDGLFRDFWEKHDVDLILTSGHATQVNLEMSFGLGAVVCANGELYCLEKTNFMRWVGYVSQGTAKGGYWFARPECEKFRQDWAARTKTPKLARSTHPKVFFGVGNCLIGDTLQGSDSMVTAWLGAGGVSQFVAYTIPTWYGKGGWGTLDLWQGLAGQLSLSEAVYLNNQRILYRLQQENPKLLEVTCLDEEPSGIKNRPVAVEVSKAPQAQQRDQFGMVYDRDALVLYGDPLWDARFDPALNKSPLTWKWDESSAGALTLTLSASKDYSTEALPVLLPRRLKNPQIQQGQEFKPMVTELFLLIPNAKFQKGSTCVIKLVES